MKDLLRASLALVAVCAELSAQGNVPARGRKVALVIGNDHYRYVTPLQTAVNDARSVQAVLRDEYAFETTLLMDATRAQIMAALTRYRRTLDPGSSLLIYYGGHGYRDPDAKKTYWWPVDAKTDDVSEWISADDITTAARALPARHLLIVSDSCFSGTLTRGVTPALPPGTDRNRTLLKLQERASRELFASGGDEPVADGGTGGHSVFAGAFLRALKTMQPSEFSVEEVFREVRVSVGGTSAQLPQLDPLRDSGHEGGSFVFSRTGNLARVDDPTPLGPGRRGPTRSARSAARANPKMNPKDGLTYVWIGPGSFTMGCSAGDNDCGEDEKPPHDVAMNTAFWIGQTPVTVGAWRRYAKATSVPMPPGVDKFGRKFNGEGGDDSQPIVAITWNEADSFCRQAGLGLPTETEWEYAARAGSTGGRYGNLNDIAWYADDSGSQPIESARLWKENQAGFDQREFANGNGPKTVAKKQPNPWMLYDMLGNVWQWTADWYDPRRYSRSDRDDVAGPADGMYRVVRGGSWVNFPSMVRVSYRERYEPGVRANNVGFRCAGDF